MSNTLGEKLKITVFGQSHSEAMGVVIDGLPAGFKPDVGAIERFMLRRAPGRDVFSTNRKEPDVPEIVSGLNADGTACGAPLCALIRNTDARSSDYDELKRKPRPGHADLAAYIKYGGFNDIRGGGQFSGRLTAPLCFAGAVCMQLLETRGIKIAARAYRIAGISDAEIDLNSFPDELTSVSENSFPTVDGDAAKRMISAILAAKDDGDSVGGIIECRVSGFPAGKGGPTFDGIESVISRAVFSVPAVKGVEFGAGFGAAEMRGSRSNDPYILRDGKPVPATNNAGGILGGITTGAPIVFRCAVKPTPSIPAVQNTVDLVSGVETELSVKGRHDPCIVPRAVPVIEAVTAIVLADILLEDQN